MATFTPQSTFAPNPTTQRATPTILSSDAKGDILVYTTGRLVVLRSISQPARTRLYAQHAQNVTVARISPTGYYCASGDAGGNVRVWDLVGEEMVLKLEKKALGGAIRDLRWDAESKRIAVVGEGSESFGTFFLFDSGSSCGEVTGHSKALNAVALKPQRPFRAVTAGDDLNVILYNGVPYKYASSASSVHTRFIQALDYASTGTHFLSAGSDGKLQLYNGSDGSPLSQLADPAAGKRDVAHDATIFAACFSPSGAEVLSAGADAALKLWDVASGKLKQTWDLKGASGGMPNDQLVGACFVGTDRVAALALSGAIHILKLSDADVKQRQTLYGATKAVGNSAFALLGDKLLLGSYDGKVLTTSVSSGAVELVQDSGSAITGVAAVGSDSAWVVSMDDTLRRYQAGKFDSTAISLSGQARSVAATDSLAVVATIAGLDVITGKSSQKKSTPTSFNPATAVAVRGSIVAVGDQTGKVHLGQLDADGAWKETALFENGRREVSALNFSPDGKLLAAGELGGRIMVYDVAEKKLLLNQWVNQTGKITSVVFSPDGTRAVSSGLDTNLFVWSVAKPMKNVAIRNAHAGGASGVVWINDTTIASTGADASVRTFTVPPLAA